MPDVFARSLRHFVLAASVALACSSSAWSQCDAWLPVPALSPPGVVQSSIVFDPDGSGPLPAQLVVCGDFALAGSVAARRIASWDGSAWHELGGGLYNGSAIQGRAMTVFNGQLIVGGRFDTAGPVAASNIAAWDGTDWHPLGAGLSGSYLGSSAGGSVLALTVFRGELIAAGDFALSGSTPLHGLARWNGSAWAPLTAGSGLGAPQVVDALISYNDELVVGGSFSSIDGIPLQSVARWNGTAWNSWGGGATSINISPAIVNAFTIYNGELIAGGLFDHIGGVAANRIAACNGTTWRALGTGLDADTYQAVIALGVHNGDLIAGGQIAAAGGVAATNIARWNGAAWFPLASGVGVQPDAQGHPTFVQCVTSFNGNLFAGGYIYSAGSLRTFGIASWDGAAWNASPPGVALTDTPVVYALASHGGQIVLGGTFSTFSGANTQVFNILPWNGIGSDSSWGSVSGAVRALKSYDTGTALNRTHHLIAGGEFTSAGTTVVNRIMQRDDGDVAAFPPPVWNAMGNGLNATVNAIERYNNATVAGGAFTATGGSSPASLSHIAQWNGTTWQQLGGGLNGTVYALRSYAGSLFAGGSFTTATNTTTPVGTITTGGLARWDGSRWSLVGGNFIGTVYALEVYNNELVIGGDFGGINSDPNLAKYNGSTYSTFGSGPGAGGAIAPVRALLSDSGNLYLGGDFVNVGGVSVHWMARWNGTAFDNVHSGPDATVFALAAWRGEIVVGGNFPRAGGNAIESAGAARYAPNAVPWIARNPDAALVDCTSRTAAFHTTVACGYPAVGYAWRRNGNPLSDGPTPTGSTLTGTHAPTLQLSAVNGGDNGSYDCIVSSTCGMVSSSAVTLTRCTADFNCNSTTEVADIFDFLNAWFAGSASANVNGGSLTVQDIFDFLNAWFAGCP